jgi:hypothetical protein
MPNIFFIYKWYIKKICYKTKKYYFNYSYCSNMRKSFNENCFKKSKQAEEILTRKVFFFLITQVTTKSKSLIKNLFLAEVLVSSRSSSRDRKILLWWNILKVYLTKKNLIRFVKIENFFQWIWNESKMEYGFTLNEIDHFGARPTYFY